MRKLVLGLVCCIHFTAFSQDVITTQSGETIKAKIIEVTEDNVSYKKYHDQQGATFILKREKIKTIAWENGDVDVYKDVVGKPDAAKESDVLPYINKKMGEFHFNTGQVYDEEHFKRFLVDKNLSHIWTKYSSGKNLLIAGWGLIGGGIVLEIVGGVVMANGNWDDELIGLPVSIIGGLLIYAGIPTAIVGTVRKTRAINDYNTMYAGRPCPQYSQNITIKAGFVGNGLGFTLNF
jgi:hypothetical protein